MFVGVRKKSVINGPFVLVYIDVAVRLNIQVMFVIKLFFLSFRYNFVQEFVKNLTNIDNLFCGI